MRVVRQITVHSRSRPGPSTAAGTPAPAISNGFTLLELILVMLIIAIAAAVVVPSLAAFGVARSTDNAAQQVVNLAMYARMQSMSEGRTYRLNFNQQARQIWLTAMSKDGTFQPPPNDFGDKYTLAQGMTMAVQVQIQPNTVLIMTPNVVATDVQPTPVFGSPVWPLVNTVMQVPRVDPGTYSEFQPSGRLDPVLVRLTDKTGREIDLGAATSTEFVHVLTKQEMQ